MSQSTLRYRDCGMWCSVAWFAAFALLINVGPMCGVLRAQGTAGDAPKATAPMVKDADPDWDVLTVKAREPNDLSTNSSLTIKGREFVIANNTVEAMLQFGYGVQKVQIVGAPHWTEIERWDVR